VPIEGYKTCKCLVAELKVGYSLSTAELTTPTALFECKFEELHKESQALNANFNLLL
jgi:hypothetical protein